MAVLEVIVRKCQSRWTSVTPGGDEEASLEFRAGMSNGSNLTSHTPSRFYQHSCWSAATVRCINLLSWPLQRLRCMLKGICAAQIIRHHFNFDLRRQWSSCVLYSIIWEYLWQHLSKVTVRKSLVDLFFAFLVSKYPPGESELKRKSRNSAIPPKYHILCNPAMPSIHTHQPPLLTQEFFQKCDSCWSSHCDLLRVSFLTPSSQLQHSNNILNSHEQAISLADTCSQEQFLVSWSQMLRKMVRIVNEFARSAWHHPNSRPPVNTHYTRNIYEVR